MHEYKNKISFVKNNRGVWDLDPFKGCEDGMKTNKNGCYGICYANKIAKFRGYNFSKCVYRYFDNQELCSLLKKISKTDFIRMGVMCDPSFDWGHTLNIVEEIQNINKSRLLNKYNTKIVIITKHWKELSESQLKKLKGLYINTSISALDTKKQITRRLFWYNKLKKHCHSILRVNTADFNNLKLQKIQNELLKNENVIDNILRFPKSHKLVEKNIINVKKHKFLKGMIYASKYNNSTYFGDCENCPDKCGINLIK